MVCPICKAAVEINEDAVNVCQSCGTAVVIHDGTIDEARVKLASITEKAELWADRLEAAGFGVMAFDGRHLIVTGPRHWCEVGLLYSSKYMAAEMRESDWLRPILLRLVAEMEAGFAAAEGGA